MKDTRKSQAESNKMSRRGFLKASGAGVAVVGADAAVAEGGKDAASSLKDARLAMVIDLHRCTGCGGCSIACKSENNVQAGVTFAKKISKTVGTFPNVRLEFIPTLCNHCERAPCVRACPTGAMHKGIANITLHTPKKCIGCRTCVAMCPYDVISRNNKETHRFWRDKTAMIKGCTSSSAEVVAKVKSEGTPYYNPAREKSSPGSGLRYKGIVEKCMFCDHLVRQGQLPHCVVACPANARIFGDLNDPNSEVSKLIAKYRPWRLREHLGTEPKVFYIREFNAGSYDRTKGHV